MVGERTLVLGGGGFLGTHVVECALRRGPGETTPPDGSPWVVSASRTPWPAGTPAPQGVGLETLDALDSAALEALWERLRPTHVVLCTALARGSDCEAYPRLALELNEEFARRVARCSASSRARLVHVSTDLVFGAVPAPEGGFAEDHPVGPLSHYGESKARGEVAVLEAWPSAVVARLPLLYGDSRGRGQGASDALLAALARGERPTLFRDEWRSPLSVRDAAAALVHLLHGEAVGRLHLAGRERVDRYAFGLAVLDRAGFDSESSERAVRAGTRADLGLEATRPADVTLDGRRARNWLARPLLGIADGLALEYSQSPSQGPA